MSPKKEVFLTKEVRHKAMVGLVEYEGLVKTSIHFSEWWNGEGMDFSISGEGNSDEIKVSLHGDDMILLSAILLKTGYIDLDDVKKLADEIIDKDY